jgi:hypothetical protein
MKHRGHHYHRREWFLLGLVAGIGLGLLMCFMHIPLVSYMLDHEATVEIESDIVPATPADPAVTPPPVAPPVVSPTPAPPKPNHSVIDPPPVAPVNTAVDLDWCGGAYRKTRGTNFGICPNA